MFDFRCLWFFNSKGKSKNQSSNRHFGTTLVKDKKTIFSWAIFRLFVLFFFIFSMWFYVERPLNSKKYDNNNIKAAKALLWNRQQCLMFQLWKPSFCCSKFARISGLYHKIRRIYTSSKSTNIYYKNSVCFIFWSKYPNEVDLTPILLSVSIGIALETATICPMCRVRSTCKSARFCSYAQMTKKRMTSKCKFWFVREKILWTVIKMK